jgi:isopentenyldiphosphate isomerase
VEGHLGALDMLIDAVDSNDQVVGAVQRRQVFNVGANFRVAHVFLFNTKRELLLQSIALGLRHAGMWGSSAAGYLSAGETYALAASRKLASELGVTCPLAFRGKTSMNDGASLKFIELYETTYDGGVFPEPTEVSKVEFVGLPTIATERANQARAFTPTFLHLLDFYLSSTARP